MHKLIFCGRVAYSSKLLIIKKSKQQRIIRYIFFFKTQVYTFVLVTIKALLVAYNKMYASFFFSLLCVSVNFIWGCNFNSLMKLAWI